MMPPKAVVKDPKTNKPIIDNWQAWVLYPGLDWKDVTDDLHMNVSVSYPELLDANNVPMIRYLTIRQSTKKPYWKI